MPWKMDEDGKFVVDENKNPIFVLDSGEEKSVDYPAMAASLTRVKKEAMERKGKIKEQEAILSPLRGPLIAGNVWNWRWRMGQDLIATPVPCQENAVTPMQKHGRYGACLIVIAGIWTQWQAIRSR